MNSKKINECHINKSGASYNLCGENLVKDIVYKLN